jgi:hypothetical protein
MKALPIGERDRQKKICGGFRGGSAEGRCFEGQMASQSIEGHRLEIGMMGA